MLKKVFILVFVMLSVESTLIQPALAKYPTRSIELVVLYTAGGATDILARLIGDTASKYLKQPIVVVNKPGAGGSVAAADVINSKPDGYKAVILSNTYFAITVKNQKIPFDPSYLVPLASFLEYKVGLGVRGDSQWKTLNELLDYGRKNPGKIRWVHAGRGTMTHIQGLLLFRKAGVQTVDIPSKGNPETLSAILGGHVDAIVFSYGNFIDHIKTGKVRYLVFLSDQRYNPEPNIPCSAELGYPEPAKLTVNWGIYVHKDTPEEIKKTLIDAFKWTYDQPEFKQGVDRLGEEARFGSPDYVKESIKKGEEGGVPILKELGLLVEK